MHSDFASVPYSLFISWLWGTWVMGDLALHSCHPCVGTSKNCRTFNTYCICCISCRSGGCSAVVAVSLLGYHRQVRTLPLPHNAPQLYWAHVQCMVYRTAVPAPAFLVDSSSCTALRVNTGLNFGPVFLSCFSRLLAEV